MLLPEGMAAAATGAGVATGAAPVSTVVLAAVDAVLTLAASVVNCVVAGSATGVAGGVSTAASVPPVTRRAAEAAAAVGDGVCSAAAVLTGDGVAGESSAAQECESVPAPPPTARIPEASSKRRVWSCSQQAGVSAPCPCAVNWSCAGQQQGCCSGSTHLPLGSYRQASQATAPAQYKHERQGKLWKACGHPAPHTRRQSHIRQSEAEAGRLALTSRVSARWVGPAPGPDLTLAGCLAVPQVRLRHSFVEVTDYSRCDQLKSEVPHRDAGSGCGCKVGAVVSSFALRLLVGSCASAESPVGSSSRP